MTLDELFDELFPFFIKHKKAPAKAEKILVDYLNTLDKYQKFWCIKFLEGKTEALNNKYLFENDREKSMPYYRMEVFVSNVRRAQGI